VCVCVCTWVGILRNNYCEIGRLLLFDLVCEYE
jgi:hypothetical protein